MIIIILIIIIIGKKICQRRAERPYLCQSSTRRADIIFRFFFQIFFFLRDGFRR